MGIFSSKKEGTHCEPDDSGATMCQRYELNEAGESIASGTNFSIYADPNNGCKPVLTNAMSINDDDQKHVEKIIQQVVKGCKVGLAGGK